MTIIALAFRNVRQDPEPWTPETCDLIRNRMMRDIPGPMRPSASRWVNPGAQFNHPGDAGGKAYAAKSKAERDRIMPIVRRMAGAGKKQAEIAKALGKSPTTIRVIMRENGIEVAGLDVAAAARCIRALAKEGQCLTQIVRETGLCNDRVYRIAKDHGIAIPKGTNKTAEQWEADAVKIRALLAQGMSKNAAARQFGRTRGWLENVLQKAGAA